MIRCLDCSKLITKTRKNGSSGHRCDSCESARNQHKLARRGPTANARLVRQLTNARGHAHCAGCGVDYAANALEVDHVVPLADGGSDNFSNLQVLCKPCHTAKTTAEQAARRLPRGFERRS